jgi:hypothetical protein
MESSGLRNIQEVAVALSQEESLSLTEVGECTSYLYTRLRPFLQTGLA